MSENNQGKIILFTLKKCENAKVWKSVIILIWLFTWELKSKYVKLWKSKKVQKGEKVTVEKV